MVAAPILHLSIGTMYNMYKFAYRTYYLYFLLAAIQSNTCNWISTPSIMVINAVVNYAFDYETANTIIKTMFWIASNVVNTTESIVNWALNRYGGFSGIVTRITCAITNKYVQVTEDALTNTPDFDVTFGKSDFDFVDVYINPQDNDFRDY